MYLKEIIINKLNNMYKIRGKILNSRIETIESKKGDTFEKMFITIEETESDFKHKYQFEIFGEESIALHKNKVKDDRYVNITFYIKANEWKDKFFNTLMIKEIISEEITDFSNPPF
jgi:hypothetical protein